MRKKRTWSKEEIELLIRNKNCSASDLAKTLNRTPDAIYRKKKELNLKSDPKWTKKKIVEQIMERYLTGKSLKAGYIHTNHKALYKAGYRIFGSWKKAIEAANIDYKEITSFEYWDQKKIIEKILERYQKGLHLSSLQVQKEYRALYVAACKHIGSWPKAIEKAGLNYSQIRRTKPAISFSRKDIINQIQRWNNEGEPLNHQHISNKYPNFEAQARRRFGSWKEAIRVSGYNYEGILLSINNEIKRGLIFEDLIKQYFSDTKPEYKYHRRIYVNKGLYYIPDFIEEEENIWIDCKLRCWSITVKNTLDKYKPFASEIHIYYLYGKSPKNQKKIKFFNILEIINSEKFPKIVKKLEKLKEDAFDEMEMIDQNKKIIKGISYYKIENDKVIRRYLSLEDIEKRIMKYYNELGYFPRKRDISRGDNLWYLIQKFGGARKLSTSLNMPFKDRPVIYDWEKLSLELIEICKSLGRFPTKGDFKKLGKSHLRPHIKRFGGSYKVAERLGYNISFRKKGYWNDFDNLKNELMPIIEKIGRMPPIKDFSEINKMEVYAAIQKHGGIYTVAKKLNVVPYRDKDESRNWEYIKNELERMKNTLGRFPSLKYIKKHGSTKLDTLIVTHFGGLHKVAVKLGEELPMRPPGYWTIEQVEKELQDIFDEIGRLPSRKDLRELNKEYLIDPIKKYGGIHKMSDVMGIKYSGRKPRGYYKNIENIKKELLPLCKKLGHFPTIKELEENNQKNLIPIITREGGFKKFSKEMGFKRKTHSQKCKNN